MKLFGRRSTQPPPSHDHGSGGVGGLLAAPMVMPDLMAAHRSLTPFSRGTPPASQAKGYDVFSRITDDWGRRQTLLGYADRLRCEQPDGSGWEFHRGASFDSDVSTGGRRLNEDDTTLQITALFRPCVSAVVWDEVRSLHRDVRHEDFEQLADARFTGLDATGAPVCVFRVRTLLVRVRMTGTLAQRQYTRVYALDVYQHLDLAALSQWMDATAATI